MILYHELGSDDLKDVLRNGLKRTNRGAKGNDQAIIETDKYLDDHRPSSLKIAGLSRNNNIYAFIGNTDSIIDIKDGATVALKDYMSDRNSVLLRLTVNPKYCYVSDIEKYDEVKFLLVSGDKVQAHKSAQDYWDTIMDFSVFRVNTIKRPEVMIVRDLLPDALSVAYPN